MTKTSNYNLPQWEAHDGLKRSDFNEAMASIDAALRAHDTSLAAAYSADNQAVECASVTVSNFAVGDTLCTFSFAPRFIIIQGVYGTAAIRQGTTFKFLDYYYYNNDYFATFRLSGPSLILYSRGSDAAVGTLVILAFR